MDESYFVKIHAKSRRLPDSERRRKENPLLKSIVPSWSFPTEVEAVAFAQTFQVCWVQVWHQGKVIYKNFDDSIKQWVLDYKKINRKIQKHRKKIARVKVQPSEKQYKEGT